MLEYVVRTVHPVKLSPSTLHFSCKVRANHSVVRYTFISICASRVMLSTQPPRTIRPRLFGLDKTRQGFVVIGAVHKPMLSPAARPVSHGISILSD